MSLLKPYISLIFKDVNPEWKKILLSPEIRPHLNLCFNKLGEYLESHNINKKKSINLYIRPNVQYILEAFKYFSPKDLKLIIIGQDPYLKSEEACGLCFSVLPNIPIPKSLNTIFKCLNETLNIPIGNNGDLRPWAKQGILLLNRFLTRSPEIKDGKVISNGDSNNEYLHSFWETFTNALIHYITHNLYELYKYKYLGIVLWGKIAQNIQNQIDLGLADVLTFGHPANFTISENNPNHFIHCPHFKEINEKLELVNLSKIEWKLSELNDPPIVVSIDGSCLGNGRDDARSSFAAYFPKEYNNKINGCGRHFYVYGLVSPTEISLNMDDFTFQLSDRKMKATNNRGELMGIINALIAILKIKIDMKIERKILLITDSMYIYNIVQNLLWKKLLENFNLDDMPNKDLIIILRNLFFKLSKIEIDKKNIHDCHAMIKNLITFEFQPSHLPVDKKRKLGGVDLERCLCNEKADYYCKLAFKNLHSYLPATIYL